MTDQPPKKPTSFDVARRAGVHRSVVSRALSGTGRMSAETRERVIQAATDLGYRVNYLARGLQNQNSGLVGIVASNLDTPYRSQQVRITARELLRNGYSPILIAAEGDDSLSGLMSRLLGYNVAGLIVTSDTPSAEIIEECARLRVPVVLINRDATAPEADRVQIDVQEAGQLAFDMLRRSGGSSFAVIDPLAETYSVSGRARAFVAACRAQSAPVDVIRPPEQDYQNGVAAADIFADLATPVDAVFGTTDLLALGFLDGLRRQGKSVPGDVQLVGFDDIEQAGWLGYDLTTIRQDSEPAACRAVPLILDRIAHPDRPYEVNQIPMTPVYRGTTKAI